MNQTILVNAIKILAEGHNVAIMWDKSDIERMQLHFELGIGCTTNDYNEFLEKLDSLFGKHIAT